MALDLQRKWDEFRPDKTQTFWFGLGCAAATLALGFGVAGWVTGGTVKNMTSEAAATARHELASAVCVAEFMAATDSGKRLGQLRNGAWHERRDLVAEGGWATMPDRDEVNFQVANMCASTLSELEPDAASGKPI
jgi:hypothetical protein